MQRTNDAVSEDASSPNSPPHPAVDAARAEMKHMFGEQNNINTVDFSTQPALPTEHAHQCMFDLAQIDRELKSFRGQSIPFDFTYRQQPDQAEACASFATVMRGDQKLKAAWNRRVLLLSNLMIETNVSAAVFAVLRNELERAQREYLATDERTRTFVHSLGFPFEHSSLQVIDGAAGPMSSRPNGVVDVERLLFIPQSEVQLLPFETLQLVRFTAELAEKRMTASHIWQSARFEELSEQFTRRFSFPSPNVSDQEQKSNTTVRTIDCGRWYQLLHVLQPMLLFHSPIKIGQPLAFTGAYGSLHTVFPCLSERDVGVLCQYARNVVEAASYVTKTLGAGDCNLTETMLNASPQRMTSLTQTVYQYLTEHPLDPVLRERLPPRAFELREVLLRAFEPVRNRWLSTTAEASQEQVHILLEQRLNHSAVFGVYRDVDQGWAARIQSIPSIWEHIRQRKWPLIYGLLGLSTCTRAAFLTLIKFYSFNSARAAYYYERDRSGTWPYITDTYEDLVTTMANVVGFPYHLVEYIFKHLSTCWGSSMKSTSSHSSVHSAAVPKALVEYFAPHMAACMYRFIHHPWEADPTVDIRNLMLTYNLAIKNVLQASGTRRKPNTEARALRTPCATLAPMRTPTPVPVPMPAPGPPGQTMCKEMVIGAAEPVRSTSRSRSKSRSLSPEVIRPLPACAAIQITNPKPANVKQPAARAPVTSTSTTPRLTDPTKRAKNQKKRTRRKQPLKVVAVDNPALKGKQTGQETKPVLQPSEQCPPVQSNTLSSVPSPVHSEPPAPTDIRTAHASQLPAPDASTSPSVRLQTPDYTSISTFLQARMHSLDDPAHDLELKDISPLEVCVYKMLFLLELVFVFKLDSVPDWLMLSGPLQDTAALQMSARGEDKHKTELHDSFISAALYLRDACTNNAPKMSNVLFQSIANEWHYVDSFRVSSPATGSIPALVPPISLIFLPPVLRDDTPFYAALISAFQTCVKDRTNRAKFSAPSPSPSLFEYCSVLSDAFEFLFTFQWPSLNSSNSTLYDTVRHLFKDLQNELKSAPPPDVRLRSLEAQLDKFRARVLFPAILSRVLVGGKALDIAGLFCPAQPNGEFDSLQDYVNTAYLARIVVYAIGQRNMQKISSKLSMTFSAALLECALKKEELDKKVGEQKSITDYEHLLLEEEKKMENNAAPPEFCIRWNRFSKLYPTLDAVCRLLYAYDRLYDILEREPPTEISESKSTPSTSAAAILTHIAEQLKTFQTTASNPNRSEALHLATVSIETLFTRFKASPSLMEPNVQRTEPGALSATVLRM